MRAKLAMCAVVAVAGTACSPGGGRGDAGDSSHVQSTGDVDTSVKSRVVQDTAIVKTDTTIRTDTSVNKDTVRRQGSRPAHSGDTTQRVP